MRAIDVSAFGQERPVNLLRRSGFQPRSAGRLSARSGRLNFSVGARRAGDGCVSFRP